MRKVLKQKLCFAVFFITLFFLQMAHAQSFQKVKGKAIDIAINPSNGRVYTVSPYKKVEYAVTNKNKKILKTLAKDVDVKRLTVTSTNSIWVVQTDKKVAKLKTGKLEVVKPFSYSTDISADKNNHIWSCFAQNGKIVKYDGQKWDYDKKYGAAADKIAVRHKTDLWVVKKDKTIKNYFKNRWFNIPGKATDIAIDRKTKAVYIVDASKQIKKWNKSKKRWDPILGSRNDVVSIAVYDNELWCTTTNRDVYYIELGGVRDFAFSKDKKKVIVLVHGITATPTFAAGIDNGVDTDRHPQFYWGFDFIKNLMGLRANPTLQLIAPKSYRKQPYNTTKLLWGDHRYSMAWRQHNNTNIDYAYVLRHPNAKADVMCTYRDGAEGLIDQTKAAIDQIYEAYQMYYGHLPQDKQPMIYLVAHSFGGIVCRTILANPTQKDRNGVALSIEDRKKANFLRNRTVWLTTLSTPHEGSPLPKTAQDNDKRLGQLIKRLDELDLKDQKKGVQGLQKFVDGKKPCLSDIRYYNFYNTRWLKANTSKRQNGDLIPIYTLTGANPGHIFFLHDRALLSPFDNSSLDIINHYGNAAKSRGDFKLGPESFQLLLLDVINARGAIGANYWKKTPANLKIGDKFKIQKPQFIDDAFTRTGVRVEMRPDNYLDSDGFVGFSSGHGITMNSNQVNYFSGKNNGSWYRIYGNDYGRFHPWDLDNHRSICYNPGTSAYIGNHLMEKGPNAVKDIYSSWNTSQTTDLKDKQIRVEIVGYKNLAGEDFGSDGYRAEVKIGSGGYKRSGNIKEKQVIGNKNFQKGKDYVWYFGQRVPNATVVPIIIKIFNYRAALNDQLCSLSKMPYLEELVIYVDTKTNRIYGEFEGSAGNRIHTVTGSVKSKRRGQLKLRIEVEDI